MPACRGSLKLSFGPPACHSGCHLRTWLPAPAQWRWLIPFWRRHAAFRAARPPPPRTCLAWPHALTPPDGTHIRAWDRAALSVPVRRPTTGRRSGVDIRACTSAAPWIIVLRAVRVYSLGVRWKVYFGHVLRILRRQGVPFLSGIGIEYGLAGGAEWWPVHVPDREVRLLTDKPGRFSPLTASRGGVRRGTHGHLHPRDGCLVAYQPLSSCRAITMRWIWLVPSHIWGS